MKKKEVLHASARKTISSSRRKLHMLNKEITNLSKKLAK